MDTRSKIITSTALLIGALGVGTGIATAGSGSASPEIPFVDDDRDDRDDGPDAPITGAELEQASAAALAHTGGGRVTDSEVGDEESRYEVEVTLDDGTEVDVQLDETFQVVGTETDGPGDD